MLKTQVEPSPYSFETRRSGRPAGPILGVCREVLCQHLVCVRRRRNVGERDLEAVGYRCVDRIDRRGGVPGGDCRCRCGCETPEDRECDYGYHLFTSSS